MSTEWPTRINFHYIKSNQFRVIHVDGVIGSVTPTGNIHFAVYSERPAIPQIITHSIESGVLGEAQSTEGRDGIVREVDADLMLSIDSARNLRDWLGERIAELEKLTAGSKPDV